MTELKHVDAGCGKQVRAHDVDVAFRQGELAAMVGLNDFGKSVVIRSVVELSHIFSGAVLIRGEDADVLGNRKVARLVSYLPQNRSLPAITAQKMVLHGRFPYQSYPQYYTDEDKQYVKDAMKKLGIWELRRQYMTNLSGGERQKVYLIMTLAGDTKGLLLDESTTWLDICYQIGFMSILKELRNKGRTVAMILHGLSAALQFAGKIVVMEQGRAVAVDTPKRVCESRILERMFHVGSHCFHSEDEKSYCYFH